MKKEVLHALGYESNSLDEYRTEQVMQGSNVLSLNDFAAVCKREALKKGFELMSSTSENAGWCWVYNKDEDQSFDEHIYHTKEKNENDAIFACFAWTLNK